MSYIHDAIKKADQKRKIGEIPDLHTEHGFTPEDPAKRAFRVYLPVLVLLVIIGGALLRFEPWQKTPVQREANVAGAVQQKTALPEASPDVADTQRERQEVRKTADQYSGEEASPPVLAGKEQHPAGQTSDVIQQRRTVKAEQPGSDQAWPLQEERDVLEQENAGERELFMEPGIAPEESAAQADPREEEAALPEEFIEEDGEGLNNQPAVVFDGDEFDDTQHSDNDAAEKESESTDFNIAEIPFIYQLPAAIQQQLPEITISFHSYTFRPATRMVRINGRILREGQDLTNEIKLEKIVPTGVVLIIDKRLFRVDV